MAWGIRGCKESWLKAGYSDTAALCAAENSISSGVALRLLRSDGHGRSLIPAFLALFNIMGRTRRPARASINHARRTAGRSSPRVRLNPRGRRAPKGGHHRFNQRVEISTAAAASLRNGLELRRDRRGRDSRERRPGCRRSTPIPRGPGPWPCGLVRSCETPFYNDHSLGNIRKGGGPYRSMCRYRRPGRASTRSSTAVFADSTRSGTSTRLADSTERGKLLSPPGSAIAPGILTSRRTLG